MGRGGGGGAPATSVFRHPRGNRRLLPSPGKGSEEGRGRTQRPAGPSHGGWRGCPAGRAGRSPEGRATLPGASKGPRRVTDGPDAPGARRPLVGAARKGLGCDQPGTFQSPLEVGGSGLPRPSASGLPPTFPQNGPFENLRRGACSVGWGGRAGARGAPVRAGTPRCRGSAGGRPRAGPPGDV